MKSHGSRSFNLFRLLALAPGVHTVTVRAEDGQGQSAHDSVSVVVGGAAHGECRVVEQGTDGGLPPGADGGLDPDPDAGPGGGKAGEGGGGCWCQGGVDLASSLWALLLFGLLGLRGARRPRRRPNSRFVRPGPSSLVAQPGPGSLVASRQGAMLALVLLVGGLTVACRPSGENRKDASTHDAFFPQDSQTPPSDSGLSDAAPRPDAEVQCTASPSGRTGTTVYLFDSFGQETGDPIVVGTVLTVKVEISIVDAPPSNVGFLILETTNLQVDLSSFTLGGSPLEVPAPFLGLVPMTLTPGTHEVAFRATVVSQLATVEVEAHLGYEDAGRCAIERSYSLAVLQVLGGIEKGVDCYDLDEARSVQVSPYVPLQATSQYREENGLRTDVLIDGLVVGGPDCPDPGVLVHQISKCFKRQATSTVTLSGAAYGGQDWFVDDILLVEILDENEEVLVALTTYQIGTQELGCCAAPPCTSALSYAGAVPPILIQNVVQGGGNNGSVPAGALDLTSHLPTGTDHFFLRFTALDQGVDGALDRVFLNVTFP